MSEQASGGSQASSTPVGSDAREAGRLLQQARESRGLTLEELASHLKVTAAKLQALESGEIQRLPDPTFARALALSMCRVLQVDSASILSHLPAARPLSIDSERPSLNQPFVRRKLQARALGTKVSPGGGLPWQRLAPALVPLVILLVAALVHWLPQAWDPVRWWQPQGLSATPAPASAPAQVSSAPASVMASGVASGVAASAPASGVTPGALAASATSQAAGAELAASAAAADFVAEPVAAASSQAGTAALGNSASAQDQSASQADVNAVLLVSAQDNSWMEIVDAHGVKRVSRLVHAGETISIGGEAPWSLRIGNPQAVEVRLRGTPVALAAYTHNNIARLELK